MFHKSFSDLLAKTTGETDACVHLRDHAEFVMWGIHQIGGHTHHVLYEFPFGANYKADFVVVLSHSGGFVVHFIEFEPVGDQIMTKKLEPAARLKGAMNQIVDWRDYVEKNQPLIQTDLARWCETKDRLLWHPPGREAVNYCGNRLRDNDTFVQFHYHIYIGRRATATGDVRRQINKYQKDGLFIGTWDRFLDAAERIDKRNADLGKPGFRNRHDGT